MEIRLNGQSLATTYYDEQDDDSRGGVLATQAVTYVNKGDTVDVFLHLVHYGEIFDNPEGFYTQFSGMLVSPGNKNY